MKLKWKIKNTKKRILIRGNSFWGPVSESFFKPRRLRQIWKSGSCSKNCFMRWENDSNMDFILFILWVKINLAITKKILERIINLKIAGLHYYVKFPKKTLSIIFGDFDKIQKYSGVNWLLMSHYSKKIKS